MNEQEHLLVCMAEECGEVTQAVTKILRFGLLNFVPGTNVTNAARLYNELCDIETISKMLVSAHVLGGMPLPTREKEYKVLDHIVIARGLGTTE